MITTFSFKSSTGKYLYIFPVLLFSLCSVILCTWFSHGYADPSYRLNKTWDNGKAAFDIYQASIAKYAKPREALVKMILVKENFDMAKHVKTRKKENGEEIIKFHTIRQIPAGIYDYFQNCTIFFERQSGKIVKLAMASLDGCGTTYVECIVSKDKVTVVSHSYMDDQGDETFQFDYHGELFYDALPFILRFGLQQAGSYRARIIPSLINNRQVPLTPVEAEISVTTKNRLTIGNVKHTMLYEVKIVSEMGTDIFLFEPSFPHRLAKWEMSNGDRLILKKPRNIEYWLHTDPEDRHLQEIDE